MRAERGQAVWEVVALTRRIDGAGVSRMLSDIALRSVLILGRFTGERKAVLDAIKKSLATPLHQYLPILFDFEKPRDRDLIETILRFAAVSRFVIADLSDLKSIPAELKEIVPQFQLLPVVLIIEASQRECPVADNILRVIELPSRWCGTGTGSICSPCSMHRYWRLPRLSRRNSIQTRPLLKRSQFLPDLPFFSLRAPPQKKAVSRSCCNP